MQAQYAIFKTPTFDNAHQGLYKKNRELYDRINNVVNQMQTEPFHNSRTLQGKMLAGLRRREVTKNVRIEFAVCLECRQTGHTDNIGCENCSDYQDFTVMLIALVKHAN